MANNNEGTRKTSRKTNNSQSAGMTSGTSNAPAAASSVPQNTPQTRNIPEAEDNDTRQTAEIVPSTSGSGQVIGSSKNPEEHEDDDFRSDYNLGLGDFEELTDMGSTYRANELPSDQDAYSEIVIEFPSCKAFSSYRDSEKGLKKLERVFTTAGRIEIG